MNIQSSFNPTNIGQSLQVRITGVRDNKLSASFVEKGFEISDGSVTKDTMILIVPYIGFTSTKVERAIKLIHNRTKTIGGEPIDPYSSDARKVYPWIMDINEANYFIKNYNQT